MTSVCKSYLETNTTKLDLPLLTERFPSFVFHSSVQNLGVVLDSKLTFSQHVTNLTRSSYFHLRRPRAIRHSVSSHVFTSIVHAFVCSRLDNCSSLLVFLLFSLFSTLLLDWLPDFLVHPTSLPSCLTIFIGYHSLLGFNSRFSH